MITNINQIKTGDKILVSSKHGLGLKIQPFQMKRDPIAGKYNHSADCWWINGELYLLEQTQAPDQKIKANANLTSIEHYLKSDSDLLLLSFVYDIEGMGLSKAYQRILANETGRIYDFHNLFKFQIVRTLFNNLWTGGKRNRDKRTVCHEEAMLIARKLGKLFNQDFFPEYYKAEVENLFWADFYKHIEIDKQKTLLSI